MYVDVMMKICLGKVQFQSHIARQYLGRSLWLDCENQKNEIGAVELVGFGTSSFIFRSNMDMRFETNVFEQWAMCKPQDGYNVRIRNSSTYKGSKGRIEIIPSEIFEAIFGISKFWTGGHSIIIDQSERGGTMPSNGI